MDGCIDKLMSQSCRASEHYPHVAYAAATCLLNYYVCYLPAYLLISSGRIECVLK